MTGMSGAGRSTAANALEDLGWYVVDNLPPQMLKPLLELTELARRRAAEGRGRRRRARPRPVREPPRGDAGAARTPARSASCSWMPRTTCSCAGSRRCAGPTRCRATARSSTASGSSARGSRRCARAPTSSSTRRRHNIHQLATEVAELFSDEGAPRHTLTIMSFGFKYGLPPDADLVADMRFLPNPFWNEELRALTGEDDAVRDYVLEQEGATRVHRRLRGGARARARGLPAREQAPLGRRDRLHRRQASLRRRWREELAAATGAEPGVAVRVKHRDLGRE